MRINRSKLVAGVLGTAMLGSAQLSWAVLINPVSGSIRAEVVNNGVVDMNGSVDIAVGTDTTLMEYNDAAIGGVTNKANAQGTYSSVDTSLLLPGQNGIQFDILTTAETASGTVAKVIQSEARVWTDSMLQFQLSLTDAEKASGLNSVELAVSANIIGSLISGGNLESLGWNPGSASMNFEFQMFGDAAGTDLLSEFILNESHTTTDPDLLSSQLDLDLVDLGPEQILQIADGSSIYIAFNQYATGSTSGTAQSTGKSFGVKSSEKILSIGVKAKGTSTVPVPEPSILMIMGLGLIGFGLFRRREKDYQ